MTEVAERSCCGRSGSSVLECGFQLDALVHTHTVDHSQCLLNSHLRPPSPPTLSNKYSTYHLQCPTNTVLTTCSDRQIQHLPPTLSSKYSTCTLQCPTNTALTTYSARHIQHLPPTLSEKYSTYHLVSDKCSTYHLQCPTNTVLTTHAANKYSTY